MESEHWREEDVIGKGSDNRTGEPGQPRRRLPTTPKPSNAPPDTPLPCVMRDKAPISENPCSEASKQKQEPENRNEPSWSHGQESLSPDGDGEPEKTELENEQG